VERDGSLLRIWVNGQSLGAFTDPAPLLSGYFGLITLASQFEGANAQFDNYRLLAWDTPPPQVGALRSGSPANALPVPSIAGPLGQE
jgi:hypothetical protein